MSKRRYRMSTRALAAEKTTAKIAAAAAELFADRPFAEVTVQAIADRAGVSLQTVLRKFGSKEGVFEAVASAVTDAVMQEREPAVGCDVPAAVAALCKSYEKMGDLGWRGLTQEDQFAWVRERMDEARRRHRRWVESSLGHLLPPRAGKERERRLLLLFAATDFYVWKLFRRDLGMTRAATVARMTDMVEALGRA